MKSCSKCNTVKNLCEFGADPRHGDGLQSHCRECQRESSDRWRSLNLERVRQYDRIRRKTPENLIEKSEYDKKYRKTPKARLTVRAKLLKRYWPKCTHEQAEQEYNKLFFKQSGCCAICNKHQSVFKKTLCIDHDHKTGKVRGLLCDNCNRGVGLLGDNKDTIASALIYLNRSNIELVKNV